MKFRIKQCFKMLLQNAGLPFVYWLNRWRKVNKKLIVFADAHHRERPDSMNYLYKALQDSEYEILEMYTDYSHAGIKELICAMFRFMKVYAMAGTVIICDNFLPVTACKKKKETTVIQLWHGAGAFKKFGYDAPDDIPPYYKGAIYRNYDLVTVSGPLCVAPFASAMRLPESVIQPIGISRMDAYFEENYAEDCKQEFYQYYPEAKGKKILLWAPTFRGNAGMPVLTGYDEIKALETQLGDEWFVVSSVHPYLARQYDLNLRNPDLKTERLIPVADVFVSDYSSVMYDALMFEKPMLLYAPDLDEYLKGRGFYLSLEEYPGHVVKDARKLKDAVIDTERYYDFAQQKVFREKYLSACDGKATSRILSYILEHD